jgi:hypothetical protein
MLIASIRRDGGTQPRVGMDAETVSEYAEAMAGGETFPPVTVYYDGTDHWLADGFHRVNAALNAGLAEIPADVRQGTLDDAKWHAAGANATHGLRRTNADKRKSVELALSTERGRASSDRVIADQCGVSHPTVTAVRAASWKDLPPENEAERRTGKDGKSYPARKPIPQPEPEEADEPLPDVSPEIDVPKRVRTLEQEDADR